MVTLHMIDFRKKVQKKFATNKKRDYICTRKTELSRGALVFPLRK